MKPTTSFYSVIQQYQVHEVGFFLCVSSQLAITCSKLTTEDASGVVLVYLLLTLNIFHTLF